MKLTSMTDFVLDIDTKIETEEMFELHGIDLIFNYAKFLKQPLKLEMFVPCDEMGEIMNYEEIKQSVIEGTDSWDAYEQAKEKVLFEGFELVDGYAIHIDEDDIIHLNEDLCLFFKSIEGFERLMVLKIKLTENALKQIGFKN